MLVVPPRSIPDFVHPPVPGQAHLLYGSNHLDSIKLPLEIAPLVSQPETHSSLDGPVRTVAEVIAAAASESDASFVNMDDVVWASLLEGNVSKLRDVVMASQPLKESIDRLSPSTGMNPLHFASSRGHADVVSFLIDEAGAAVDAQDREGETALLKASYAGHTSIVGFLIKRGANVHQRDKDGWSALHNASSKGFINIAQILLEKGGVNINIKSKMHHTPLMNAVSKGDVSTVQYFLNHAGADPLIKNKFGETAYDVAATNSEAYLCSILQEAEKRAWKSPRGSSHHHEGYDSLLIHDTVVVTIHENQRATSSFPLSLMTPKFSPNTLAQQDICGPWSLPSGRPSTMDDVHLPLVPGVASSSKDNIQRGWFWLTEWVLDRTDPNTDEEGWQYGKSLMDQNQLWTAVAPTSGSNWVRRRKWIRVMKKRLDLSDSKATPETTATDEPDSLDIADYVRRSHLALRSADGFESTEQEQLRYHQAIQILLEGVKDRRTTSLDASGKEKAAALVRSYLDHAETLAQSRRELANSERQVLNLESPRPLLAASGDRENEFRHLPVLRSSPNDAVYSDALSLDTEATPSMTLSKAHHVETAHVESMRFSAEETISSISALDAEEQQRQVEVGNGEVSTPASLVEADHALSSSRDVRLEQSEAVSTPELRSTGEEAVPPSPLDIPPPASPIEAVVPGMFSTTPVVSEPGPLPKGRLTRSPVSARSLSQRVSISQESCPQGNSSGESDSHDRSETSNDHFDVPVNGVAALNITGASSQSQSGESQQTAHAQPSASTPLDNQSDSPPRQLPRHSNTTQPSRSRTITPPQTTPRRATTGQNVPVETARWEQDHKVADCRECHRKFSLWLRRHHCRRCGHVVCDRCSSHRSALPPSMVVYDPASSEAYIAHYQSLNRRGPYQSYRVCDSCYGQVGAGFTPGSLAANHGSAAGSGAGVGAGAVASASMGSSSTSRNHQPSFYGSTASHNMTHHSSPTVGVYGASNNSYAGASSSTNLSASDSESSVHRGHHPSQMTRNASSSSLMNECPVCGIVLSGIEGGKAAEEVHVQECLEGKTTQSRGGVVSGIRYIVYRLPAEAPLVGQECAICFEEFAAGRTVARLTCLCTFHKACIATWLTHGKSCPVHYR